MGDHYDENGDGVADHGEYEVCDDRPRDAEGNLLDGFPDPDHGPEEDAR